VNSNITLSRKHFSFAILYLGNHHLIGNTSDNMSEHHFNMVAADIRNAFNAGNLSTSIDLIKKHFTDRGFSFYDLLLDEQMELLDRVLEHNIEMALSSYEKINERSYSLLSVMKNNRLRIPPILYQNLETVTNYYIEEILKENDVFIQLKRLEEQIAEVERWNLKLDTEKIAFIATNRIHQIIEHFEKERMEAPVLEQIIQMIELLEKIDVSPALHELQNYIFSLVKQYGEPYAHCEDSLKKLALKINIDVDTIKKKMIHA
jgi:hypothetical protein